MEGVGLALRAMAAYIDLNPVRAGICDDPKDDRRCGHAEAVAGGKRARQAVASLDLINPHGGLRSPGGAGETAVRSPRPTDALRRWRCHLFGVPESAARQLEEAAKQDKAALFRKRGLHK